MTKIVISDEPYRVYLATDAGRMQKVAHIAMPQNKILYFEEEYK